jgi:uncharacterized membrane protein (DUF4010 family)
MPPQVEQLTALAVALGIGLLLGVERERRKTEGPERDAAGIRTFALVALLGSLSAVIPISGLPIVVGVFVGALAVVSYLRSSATDPGITTEMALMTAYLLGLLTQSALTIAGGLGVVITILLASRETLHQFVSNTLSAAEFHDALVLGAVALVILPLVPDTGIGPFQAFNPFTAWRLVVIVMLANAAGYVAQRMFGASLGLPLAGFFGGFVSSTATIAAMRSRASDARMVKPAVAGAVLSNIATILQLGLVVASTSTATFLAVLPSLVIGGIVATVYGTVMAALARGSLEGDYAATREAIRVSLGARISRHGFDDYGLLNGALESSRPAGCNARRGLRRLCRRSFGSDFDVFARGRRQTRSGRGRGSDTSRGNYQCHHEAGGCL